MNSVEIRPETYTGSMAENPLIVELLGLLAKNMAVEQYEQFGQLVSCMSAMEEQLNRTATELSAVRQELRTLQDGLSKDDRAHLSRLTASLGTAIIRGREQLRGIKENIVSAAKTAVRSLKDKGVIGLHETLAVLGIRKAMTALQTHLNHIAQALETGMSRVEAVKQEFQEAGGHVRNVGRVISGKERQEVRADQTQSRKGAIITPLRHIHGALRKAEDLAGQAVGHLEKLEQAAIEKKPSIKKTLKNFESDRPASPKKAIAKEQPVR